MASNGRAAQLPVDPLWYKDAIVYQLHVRAFYDSDGDGIGDFAGLTQKLDYLQDLGVTALWLLPFYPSPLRDDGYDTSDYTDVNPMYGTLADFKSFLREAHVRGLRVITELVLNHTSDAHPWFQRARRAKPGSNHRNFYVWNDSPDKYREARIIFKDFESSNWSWDPVAQAYFWHRFYAHQPDLNFDNPAVHEALFSVLNYWLKLGVDGLRLDAVPYLYEREGTNCENLAETHAFLKQLRRRIDENFVGRMLLAEANQWPEDAIAYFGDGDECHTAFHFPLMPRMFMAIQMEDRFPMIDILQQTPAIPDTCQWMLFLRNHDELTLEMVTDEERDYMYRVYAHDRQARINLGIRRRLAPLLGNNRRKIELMNGLLFSLPGTPIIYYGDEIGMGDNIYLGDRDGVRTPMQWSPDRNAGFSRANPQRLYLPIIIDPEYHYESLNVDTQNNNPQSLLWWMKRLIALRQLYPAFSRGTLDFVSLDNRKVLAFVRRYEDQPVLVVANLSRFVQYAELDLSEFEGATPVELFGQTKFPRIGRLPYLLTIGPHTFYWFVLQSPKVEQVSTRGRRGTADRAISVQDDWTEVFAGRPRHALELALRGLLPSFRWFGGKARTIQAVRLVDAVAAGNEHAAYFVLVNVEYTEGEPERYLIPMACAMGEEAEGVIMRSPEAVLGYIQVRNSDQAGILYDATVTQKFNRTLLELIHRRRRLRGLRGDSELAGSAGSVLRALLPAETQLPDAGPMRGEQSNTSVIYGDKLILKLFRKIQPGTNPDLEIGRYLTEKAGFPNIPPTVGAIEYRRGKEEPATLALLQGFVHNEGDAWRYTLDSLSIYYESILTDPERVKTMSQLPWGQSLVELAGGEIPHAAHDFIGTYLHLAALLGRRTAEMHTALAREKNDPAFAPEPFGQLYQRSVYQSMRKQAVSIFSLLKHTASALPPAAAELAEQLRQREKDVLACLYSFTTLKTHALRIRIHGDYHLGQVLYTGKDFVIIDFEGEPARPMSERRLKRSALLDVAGMIRSFHYAAASALERRLEMGVTGTEMEADLRRASWFWYLWVSATFLKEYLAAADGDVFVPRSLGEVASFLNVFLLHKAVYELGYELNNRPHWVEVPLRGILEILEITHCSEKDAAAPAR
jgi:maltose alpha-D-glucosyltransferase/alpha-amylase